jgi:hypothetical protein
MTTTLSEIGFHRECKILGLRIAWNRYARPQRPSSGGPIGIWESLWIYTRRHAWGFGKVGDWATPDKIEIGVGKIIQTAPDMRPHALHVKRWPAVSSERGSFDVSPALWASSEDQFAITVENKHSFPVKATVALIAVVNFNDFSPNDPRYGPRSIPVAVSAQSFDLKANSCHNYQIPARSALMEAIDQKRVAGAQLTRGVLAPCSVQLAKVTYWTTSSAADRRQRLYGRPEWEHTAV